MRKLVKESKMIRGSECESWHFWQSQEWKKKNERNQNNRMTLGKESMIPTCKSIIRLITQQNEQNVNIRKEHMKIA